MAHQDWAAAIHLSLIRIAFDIFGLRENLHGEQLTDTQVHTASGMHQPWLVLTHDACNKIVHAQPMTSVMQCASSRSAGVLRTSCHKGESASNCDILHTWETDMQFADSLEAVSLMFPMRIQLESIAIALYQLK